MSFLELIGTVIFVGFTVYKIVSLEQRVAFAEDQNERLRDICDGIVNLMQSEFSSMPQFDATSKADIDAAGGIVEYLKGRDGVLCEGAPPKSSKLASRKPKSPPPPQPPKANITF